MCVCVCVVSNGTHTHDRTRAHVVWLDSRTHAIVEELLQQENFQAAGKDTLRPVCGLPLSTYFSATKLVWLIKNVPAVQQAIQDDRCIFGTVDTWLIWVRAHRQVSTIGVSAALTHDRTHDHAHAHAKHRI